MDTAPRTDTSLLGALLVAEEMVTQEQLDACLMLQRNDLPHLPIGEVLLRYGYITRGDLNKVLELQWSIRESLIARVDTQGPPLPDLRALLLSAEPPDALVQLLRDHGVAVDRPRGRHDGAPLSYDLILVAPGHLERLAAGACGDALVGLLPPLAADEPLRPEASALLVRYIEQARAVAGARGDLERQRHRQYELQMTELLMRNVAGARTPHEALLKLMMIVRDLIPVEAGTLYRLEGDTSSLVFEIVLGPSHGELTHQRIPLTQGVAGWVARHGEPLIIPDVHRDERFSGAFDSKTGFQTHSMLCVPMHALGRTQGVLQLINKLEEQFDEHDLLLLRLTAAIGGLILQLGAQPDNAGPAWLGDLAEQLDSPAASGRERAYTA